MFRLWRFDIVYGLTKGCWFQYLRVMPFAYKIIDIGFRPILIAIYYRVN